MDAMEKGLESLHDEFTRMREIGSHLRFIDCIEKTPMQLLREKGLVPPDDFSVAFSLVPASQSGANEAVAPPAPLPAAVYSTDSRPIGIVSIQNMMIVIS